VAGRREIDTDEHGASASGSTGISAKFLADARRLWASKRWGAQFTPRVGMEVVVAYEEGDPDIR
jgi:uncharacterized protein involved in type VI secretion and phage assembly